MTRSPHLVIRPLKRRPTDGRRSFAFGFRLGYWPCLYAPFIQFTILFWRIDLWYGWAEGLKPPRVTA